MERCARVGAVLLPLCGGAGGALFRRAGELAGRDRPAASGVTDHEPAAAQGRLGPECRGWGCSYVEALVPAAATLTGAGWWTRLIVRQDGERVKPSAGCD